MLVNLRGHRRKGELDNVYFLCLFLCLSHKNFFRQLLCTANNFLYHFAGGGIFSIVSPKQNKMLLQFCSNS